MIFLIRLFKLAGLMSVIALATMAGGIACGDDESGSDTTSGTTDTVAATVADTDLPTWVDRDDPEASVSGIYESPANQYELLAFFDDGTYAISDMESYGDGAYEIDLDAAVLDAGVMGVFAFGASPGALADESGADWTRKSGIANADLNDPATEELLRQADKLMAQADENDRLVELNDKRLDQLEELARKINGDPTSDLWDEYNRIDEKIDEKTLTSKQVTRLDTISNTAIGKTGDGDRDPPSSSGAVDLKLLAGEYVSPGGDDADCVRIHEEGAFEQGYGLALMEDYIITHANSMTFTTGGAGAWTVASDYGSITNEKGTVYQRGECPVDPYRAY
jgi:hypothetical protein